MCCRRSSFRATAGTGQRPKIDACTSKGLLSWAAFEFFVGLIVSSSFMDETMQLGCLVRLVRGRDCDVDVEAARFWLFDSR